jgi:poly-gamma-glutamate synthesis protein (capsule biosynthesis protein)
MLRSTTLPSTLAAAALLGLAACSPLWGAVPPGGTGDQAAPAADATSFAAGPAAAEATSSTAGSDSGSPAPTAAPSPTPQTLWISPSVPDALRAYALGAQLTIIGDPAVASLRLDLAAGDGAQSSWIYALVTPFPALTDGVRLSELLAAWGGAVAPPPFSGRPLWMDAPTLGALTAAWGAPASGSVQVAALADLPELAWADRPAWAIVPFEALEPRWKVLTVDGQSPVRNDFDPNRYPLKAAFSLQPPSFSLPAANRDPARLTVLAMTGVTALVRQTAIRMDRHGALYPAQEIGPVLRSADLTHISNEVPFAEGCPPPDPDPGSLRFCSDPGYMALLEDVGADVIELTGNHFQDYGSTAALFSLDLYDQHGLPYFGGGRDLEASFEPVRIVDHGNRFAFIGCNYAGPTANWADVGWPGSTPCDYPRLEEIIAGLRADGYLPIMTFQFYEYYQPEPTDYEVRDFRRMADAGAVIVSGSQSHFPAAMEFYAGSFIHYGLGNLFFDQMWYELPGGELTDLTSKLFVDLHVFYDGRHVSSELLTYKIEDYARPRPMTDAERSPFLEYIFGAAGW